MKRKRIWALAVLAVVAVLAISPGVLAGDGWTNFDKVALINDKYLDELTDAEVLQFTPELDSLRSQIDGYVIQAQALTVRVDAKWDEMQAVKLEEDRAALEAELDSLEASLMTVEANKEVVLESLESQVEGVLEANATDHELRGSGWTTKVSTLKKVRQNMGRNDNVQQAAGAASLLGAFHSQSIKDTIINGVWEWGPEFDIQFMMSGGYTYEQARQSVLKTGGMTAGEAAVRVEQEARYDAGLITWGEVLSGSNLVEEELP